MNESVSSDCLLVNAIVASIVVRRATAKLTISTLRYIISLVHAGWLLPIISIATANARKTCIDLKSRFRNEICRKKKKKQKKADFLMHFASECNTFALVYRVMRLCEWQNKWWFCLCHALKAFDSHHFFIFSQIIMIMHLNGTWKTHTHSSIHQELINYNCFNKWNQFDRLFQFLCRSFDVVVAAAAVFHLRSMQHEQNWMKKNERTL